eukprot:SAG31_NODE_5797_length_2323_cov_3.180842_6_plen_131_part_01
MAVQEDNARIVETGAEFWHSVGLLHILYTTNCLPRARASVYLEGPKAADHEFVLNALNKCEAYSDWKRWLSSVQSAQSAEPLDFVENRFELDSRTLCFLSHSFAVPLAFRQQCVRFDVWATVGEQTLPLAL